MVNKLFLLVLEHVLTYRYKQACIFSHILKDSCLALSASRNLGSELGPMPCSCKTSDSLYIDNCSKLVIPLFSNALLAGAAN